MLENYRTLKRGKKTEYKLALARELNLALHTVNGYISSGEWPEEYIETIKDFDKQYEVKVKEEFFWKDGDYEAKGGFYIRAYDFIKFLDLLKEKGHEPVGFKIEDGSKNVEVIVRQ